MACGICQNLSWKTVGPTGVKKTCSQDQCNTELTRKNVNKVMSANGSSASLQPLNPWPLDP